MLLNQRYVWYTGETQYGTSKVFLMGPLLPAHRPTPRVDESFWMVPTLFPWMD